MGRKIPGKKHKKIKYPEQQQAKRLAELEKKINAPPRNADDQAIPKSLQRVIELKNDVKAGKFSMKKQKKKKNKLISVQSNPPKNLDPKAKPVKIVPAFNQKPDENIDAFWFRVSRETHNFVNETKFEKKFSVEVKRNEQTGEIEGLEKKKKDELEEYSRLIKKHQNIKKKKKKKTSDVAPRLTKVEKRKNKIEMKKAKKLQDNIDNSKPVKEKIEFGDIVHAPPELKIRPTNAPKITKPAAKNLLLNSLFNENKKEESNKTNNIINKTGKRKNLPCAERRLLENQQSEVIEAYRLLKSRKSKQ